MFRVDLQCPWTRHVEPDLEHTLPSGEVSTLAKMSVVEAERLFADLGSDVTEPELLYVYRREWLRFHCRYCGRKRDHDPGDHYHEKACEMKYARARLREAQATGADAETIRELKQAFEQAAYVGD